MSDTATRDRVVDDDRDKPVGREAVRAALVDATTELIIEQGVTMSVREIAQRAGVNHGLVHTYFGSKDDLLTAAFGAIVARAATETDPHGFPPPDLALRRNGELARAFARVMLDVGGDPFPDHPILPAWRRALATARPGADTDELDGAIAIATALAFGWALFADHLCGILAIDADGRRSIEQSVTELVAEIGGIPERSAVTANSSSD